jgi:hypothetical protein
MAALRWSGTVWTCLALGCSSSSHPAHPDAPGAQTGACALPNYPDETCTGVPAGTTLQRVPDDVTSGSGWTWNAADQAVLVTDDNAVVEGLDVQGCILAHATGVTVRSSKAQCISTADDPRARDPASPRLTIEDCEVACNDTDGTTAIGDRNLTALRVNIHGCENGFDLDSDGTIQDSYIHDLHQSTVAHTDGLQSAVGSNLIVQHNRIYAETPGACGVPSGHTSDCGGTSAVNINNNPTGPVSTNTTIRDNLLAGGAYTLYCPKVTPSSFHVVDNHWSRIFYPSSGAFGPDADCLADNGDPLVTEWTGNVWDDTGLAVGP